MDFFDTKDLDRYSIHTTDVFSVNDDPTTHTLKGLGNYCDAIYV